MVLGKITDVTPTITGNLSHLGIRGFSAYEIACQHGFVGTESQWLDSLRYDHSDEFERLVQEVKRYLDETQKLHDEFLSEKTGLEKSVANSIIASNKATEAANSVKGLAEEANTKAEASLIKASEAANRFNNLADWVKSDTKPIYTAEEVRAYSKPNSGIPKSDLTNSVQASLNKADTALQSVPDGYATETWVENKGYLTEHQSLSNYYTKEEVDDVASKSGKVKTVNGNEPDANGDATVNIPTKVSDLENDEGYLKEHQSLESYALKTDVEGLISEVDANNKYQPKGEYLTEHQSLTDYATKNYVDNKQYDYYTKPNNGIPKSDLSEEVKQSLTKADTVLDGIDKIVAEKDESTNDTKIAYSIDGTEIEIPTMEDLEAYATKEYVNELINSRLTSLEELSAQILDII